MANQLQEVVPQLLAQGLLALRENAVTHRLVNRSYEREAGEKGDTIKIPIPSAVLVTNVVPGPTAPNPGDLIPTSVNLPLDQWKEAAFTLSDKEQLEVMDGFIPMAASEALKALVNVVDKDILSSYKEAYQFVGTPASTPFATDTSDAANSRKELSNGLAPMDDRWMVLNPDAVANALNLRAFQDLSWVGDRQAIIDGIIDRRMGFGWAENQNVLTHTAGDAAGWTVSGAHAIDETSIAIAGGSGNFLEGDIITFAGDPQTYVVTADAAGSPITISPGLVLAKSGGEAVTVKGDHVVNLAFQRDAIAFASRPLLSDPDIALAVESQVDPISGIALRLQVTREYNRLRWAWDILYGKKVIRPSFITRLAG